MLYQIWKIIVYVIFVSCWIYWEWRLLDDFGKLQWQDKDPITTRVGSYVTVQWSMRGASSLLPWLIEGEHDEQLSIFIVNHYVGNSLALLFVRNSAPYCNSFVIRIMSRKNKTGTESTTSLNNDYPRSSWSIFVQGNGGGMNQWTLVELFRGQRARHNDVRNHITSLMSTLKRDIACQQGDNSLPKMAEERCER